jgi:hypothetical protein
MKYERILTSDFLELLKPGGRMAWLLPLALTVPQSEPWALDVQLRRKNTVMFYQGTTCVLSVHYELSAGRPRISFSADKAYVRAEQPSATAYAALMHSWPIEQACALESSCRAYLEAVMNSTSTRYYNNQKEGFWQNRLAVRFGRAFTTADEWLIVDRECVIELGVAPNERRQLKNIITRHEELSATLQREDKARFGSRPIRFGVELDFLAINRDGELACVELKYGDNPSGIYWAPLQVSVYQQMYQLALPQIAARIDEMVRQKVALQLLPGEALRRLPLKAHIAHPVVAVAAPNARSGCWKSLSIVQSRLDSGPIPVVTVVDDGGGLQLKPGVPAAAS